MRRPWIRGAIAWTLIAIAAVVVMRAPTAAALEFETVPAKVEPNRWSTGPVPPARTPFKGRTVELNIFSGYCIGDPKPRIDHVRVVERPATAALPFKSALITVFLRYPEHQRVIPPPDPGNVVYNACAGLGLNLRKRIKLRRPTENLRLFDGADSPPRRVWPKPTHVYVPVRQTAP